jgi:hypothetical protein
MPDPPIAPDPGGSEWQIADTAKGYAAMVTVSRA